MYPNPPTWNFPVQACDSNYITLKQIQIIDTLVAKFRKPQQLWRHLEVPLQYVLAGQKVRTAAAATETARVLKMRGKKAVVQPWHMCSSVALTLACP